MHRKPTGQGRRFAVAVSLALVAGAAGLALGGSDLHVGFVLADPEGQREEARRRLAGFEARSSGVASLFGSFARPILGGGEADDRARDGLVRLLAEHYLDVGSLALHVAAEADPLLAEYRTALWTIQDAVRRSSGPGDLERALVAIGRIGELRRDILEAAAIPSP